MIGDELITQLAPRLLTYDVLEHHRLDLGPCRCRGRLGQDQRQGPIRRRMALRSSQLAGGSVRWRRQANVRFPRIPDVSVVSAFDPKPTSGISSFGVMVCFDDSRGQDYRAVENA
jgi:hypothetical protein